MGDKATHNIQGLTVVAYFPAPTWLMSDVRLVRHLLNCKWMRAHSNYHRQSKEEIKLVSTLIELYKLNFPYSFIDVPVGPSAAPTKGKGQ